MNKAFSNKYLKLMLAFISILVYTNLTYNLHRQQFYLIILSLSFLFFSYWIFLNLSTRLSLGLGVMFRLVFLLGLPMLSQDFYRFIWDGQVLLHHINPYSFTPEAKNAFFS
jgi:alpha-1,6-mannosyltransferase